MCIRDRSPHVYIQCFFIHIILIGIPHHSQQLFSCEHLIPVSQKGFQKTDFRGSQFYLLPVLSQLFSIKVIGQRTGIIKSAVCIFRSFQKHFNPPKQHSHRKRLCHVVVAPCVKSLQHIRLCIPGGQKQYRNRITCLLYTSRCV